MLSAPSTLLASTLTAVLRSVSISIPILQIYELRDKEVMLGGSWSLVCEDQGKVEGRRRH